MTNSLTDQQYNEQRLDAIELVLETVLPMLISTAPNQKEVRQQLLQLVQAPPVHMKDNIALGMLVDGIELACPSDDAAQL